MNGRKRSRDLLRASGLSVPSSLPSIKERHDEGAPTPENTVRSPYVPPGPVPLAPSPLPSTVTLPDHLKLLSKIWESILTARGLLLRRKEFITLQTLKPIVENCTGRQFKEQYLQQIKHLYPEAFSWQYVRAPSATVDRQFEYQLLLKFDRAARSGGGSGGSGGSGGPRFSDAAERAAFEERLQAFHQQQPPLPPPGAAAGPDAMDTSEVADPAAGAAAGPVAAELLVPLAELPSKEQCLTTNSPMSSGSSPHPSRSSGVRSQGGQHSTPSRSTAPGAGAPQGTPSSRPPSGAAAAAAGMLSPGGDSAAAAVKRRKLGFGELTDSPSSGAAGAAAGGGGGGGSSGLPPAGVGPGLARAGSGSGAAAALSRQGSAGSCLSPGATASTPGRRPNTPTSAATPSSVARLPPAGSLTPTSARRNPMLARLMSAEALEALDKSEAALQQSPAARARREELHALGHLALTFDLVRVIFGVKGACVKPKAEVVLALREKSTHRGGMTAAEAQRQLEALAREAPDFLHIEQQGPGVRDDGELVAEQGQGPQGDGGQGQGQAGAPGLVVRLNRDVDLDKVRKRLAEVSRRAGAGSSGV